MPESSPTKKYDIYASILNYKKKVATLNRPFVNLSWMPEDHERRMQAYEILTSFYENYSRDYRFSPESGDTSYNDLIKEEGDAAWLCNKIKAKLIGDNVTISIPLPKVVRKLTKLKKKLAEAGENGNEAIQNEINELGVLRDKIEDREAYLQDWWNDYDIFLAVDKNETKASYLGDCVFYVEWNKKDGVPTIKTYDPGMCFPDWDYNGASLQDDIESIVKDRFVIAWEEKADSDSYFLVWRDIYELRDIGNGEYRCFRQYGYYKYSGGAEIELMDIPDGDLVEDTSAGWEDLGIDFLPIVWIPNIELEGEDYGKSNLKDHLATLDGLINDATDLSKNSEKLGGAIVGVSGKNLTAKKDSTTGEPVPVEIQPNAVYFLGENGKLEVVDTSEMQRALLETKKAHEDKLIRNSDITEVAAGIATTQTELSGVALRMLLQPLLDKINPMRRQRQRRYAQLFYLVQRLMQIFGNAEQKAMFTDPLYDVVMNFGNLIPTDRKSKIEEYILMLEIYDLETVLEIAQSEGADINVETVLRRKAEERAQKIQEQQAAFTYQRDQDAGGGENDED